MSDAPQRERGAVILRKWFKGQAKPGSSKMIGKASMTARTGMQGGASGVGLKAYLGLEDDRAAEWQQQQHQPIFAGATSLIG